MKTLFGTLKAFFHSLEKRKNKTSQMQDLGLVEKWWLNDEILSSIQGTKI